TVVRTLKLRSARLRLAGAWKLNSKASSLTYAGRDLDVSAEGAHVFTGLVRADAHAPRTLRAIERPGQTFTQEQRIHSVAGIFDHDTNAGRIEIHFDADASCFLGRFLRVADDVLQNHAQALGIGNHEGLLIGELHGRFRFTHRTPADGFHDHRRNGDHPFVAGGTSTLQLFDD